MQKQRLWEKIFKNKYRLNYDAISRTDVMFQALYKVYLHPPLKKSPSPCIRDRTILK